MRKTLLLVAAFVLVALTLAQADSLVITRPTNGTDSVDWSQLGPSMTPINNPFSFTTANSVSGTGSFAGGGQGQVRQQGNGWNGNFSPNDFLVWTNSPGQGPLTLTFSQGYSQVGAQIQADFFGAFVAQICDNGNGQCFSEAGNSNPNGDGSAIYLGIAGSNISSVTFSVLSCTQDCADFAINQMTLGGGMTTVPEPSSLLLMGSGLLGLVGVVRRRFLV